MLGSLTGDRDGQAHLFQLPLPGRYRLPGKYGSAEQGRDQLTKAKALNPLEPPWGHVLQNGLTAKPSSIGGCQLYNLCALSGPNAFRNERSQVSFRDPSPKFGSLHLEGS